MKLLSWNVNGIRSVHRNGFAKWFAQESADIICVQETKAQPEQLEEDVRNPKRYHAFWHSAKKLGYSGVATFSKQEPTHVRYGLGIPEIDNEGRVLVTEFKNFVLLNCYFPNSQRDHARLGFKLTFCEEFFKFCEAQRRKGKNVVICGDFNIAHKEIDLKNPKSNMKNAGFLPEERAWMEQFTSHGYADTFRHFNKEPGHYTWWSYRPGVREKNVGWRLDYFFVNGEFKDRLKVAEHQNHILGSDHCPVFLQLKK
jgi:exodeoxyribonuclease III